MNRVALITGASRGIGLGSALELAKLGHDLVINYATNSTAAQQTAVEDFRKHVTSLGVELPCEDSIAIGKASPLTQPIEAVTVNSKRIGNRWAVQPMEGWDGTTTGGATEEVRRRWQRFGESGAKLIFGGEAMAVRPDGRANPNQLIIVEQNKKDLAELREIPVRAHQESRQGGGKTDDLVMGFQLTHSGRFCKLTDKQRMAPRVAFRHPILDRKFGVTSGAQVFTDSEIEKLIQCYIRAANLAWDVGADFVDIKHCHGYLLHVAQYVVRNGWSEMISLGRMVLSYPDILADAVEIGALQPKMICRTFSDCTTAPRNGMISGCYPLDRYHSAKPEFQQWKEMKKKAGA